MRISDWCSDVFSSDLILHYSVIVLPRLAITIPTSTSEGEILTLKQVAEFLKVTDLTIYRLAAAKKIPAFKLGGTLRFPKAEITEWIQQQGQGGKADNTSDRKSGGMG